MGDEGSETHIRQSFMRPFVTNSSGSEDPSE